MWSPAAIFTAAKGLLLPVCCLITTVGSVDMTRLCPAGISVTAETKSRSVCQDVHRKPSCPPLSIQPFPLGSDWRRLYQDNLTQKSTSFSLILKRSWAVPNKPECWFLRKAFAFWASICLSFVGLCTEPSARNVRLWKLLLRFVEAVFAVCFHRAQFLWFQDSMNTKLN